MLFDLPKDVLSHVFGFNRPNSWKVRFSNKVLPCLDKGWKLVYHRPSNNKCYNCYENNNCDKCHYFGHGISWMSRDEFIRLRHHFWLRETNTERALFMAFIGRYFVSKY
jgi:hypothetical protein